MCVCVQCGVQGSTYRSWLLTLHWGSGHGTQRLRLVRQGCFPLVHLNGLMSWQLWKGIFHIEEQGRDWPTS